ncbi:MAG TPA: TSUP family transporter [Candidatus Acidoferrum sp.]|nr:TSUP family transporter [Candidatus Acidoferrum sp.]
MELLLLCGCAFAAGLIDAVVGGGGLIQLPALLVFLPKELSASVPLVFGTNKFSSIFGTATAVAQYAPRVRMPWRTILPAAATAFVFSVIGVQCVQAIRSDILKPLVFVLLILVAIYTYARKDFGHLHAPRFLSHHEVRAGILVGMVLGFYDGFFGPGTGSFLIFLFIGLFRFDFLTASASAKVINFATNLAAGLAFGLAGNILWKYGAAMAVCNVAGSLVGTRLAMARGNRFVRLLFLCVVTAMIARYGWELFGR